MQDVWEHIIRLTAGIGITDVIDILIVAFVIYKVLGFIRETRAEQLVKGLLVLVVAAFISEYFNLHVLNWILRGTMTLGVIALVIVFQPELRRALEVVGRSKLAKVPFVYIDKEKAKALAAKFIKAVDYFSTHKIGALIVLERETLLNDIAETGTTINAEVSYEILRNLFFEGAPLHDGAVIVRGDKVLAAGCVLPLTHNNTLGKDLGTRHRAGIGITESSDAIAIIVSEETGIISIAVDGKLTRFLDIKTVEKTLLNIYLSDKDEEKKSVLKRLLRRVKKNDDASK
ncbi:MAG: diadenylate cyclase CdaA [Clostridiales bacterium]|nr:diadenylate cyclase CdaA [Clostridiales bacterium]